MDIKQKRFLDIVKAILVTYFVCKDDLKLDEKSWLSYYENGYKPYHAVKEDFEGYTIPFFSWNKIHETLIRLKMRK